MAHSGWVIFESLSCWHWQESKVRLTATSVMHSVPAEWKWDPLEAIQAQWKQQAFPKQSRLSDWFPLFIRCLIVLPSITPRCAVGVVVSASRCWQPCSRGAVILQLKCIAAAERARQRKLKIEKNVFMHSHKELNWHKAAPCFNYAECLSRELHGSHILKRTKSPHYVLSKCCSDSHARRVLCDVGSVSLEKF